MSLVPYVVEQTSRGERSYDIFSRLLNDGEEETCIRDGYYRRALTIYRGLLTHEETSAVQGKPWVRPEEALGISGFRLDPAPLASDTRSTHFYSWAEDGGAQTEHSS